MYGENERAPVSNFFQPMRTFVPRSGTQPDQLRGPPPPGAGRGTSCLSLCIESRRTEQTMDSVSTWTMWPAWRYAMASRPKDEACFGPPGWRMSREETGPDGRSGRSPGPPFWFQDME
ncbi:MAG: hypothetical protein BWY99_02389 [Synergistetes bacterium ADurb.BinA166]|nr:MAG: hypothetical protein BWY99_02389 [Synergistetes bacterium ADurb.BinA166]